MVAEAILKHLSLFSGIGGFDLAAEWAGIETVGQCEIDPFCQGVLRKHWPGVKLWGDIRNVNGEEVERHCGTIGIITGGFPCQPVSVAGKRKGTTDDRWLWPEMLRVIREVKPRWVVAENVAGIGHLVESGRFLDVEGQVVEEDKFDEATQLVLLERTWNDLEAAGYEVQPVSIPACGCSAWHERQRVFVVAYRTSGRRKECSPVGQAPNDIDQKVKLRIASDRKGGESRKPKARDGGQSVERRSSVVADADSQRFEKQCVEKSVDEGTRWSEPKCQSWWKTEPAVGRMVYGFSGRVDQLKALGNAVVPQVAYRILKAIVEIEKGGLNHG